jgi:chitinase
MSYDLHGTWDADSQFVGPYIAPHTNLTEIDLGLGLLWRAGVAASKVVRKERSLSLDTKTEPVSERPPSSSHSPLPTSSAPCKRADDDNCGRPQRTGPDIYESIHSATILPAAITSTCHGLGVQPGGIKPWIQACLQ